MNTHIEQILKFREWVDAHRHQGHPVRQSAALLAQSSVVRRMLECEFESTLNRYNAGELLNMLAFAGFGRFTELLLNTAYSRAIVEDDHEIIAELSNYDLIPEQQQWFHRLNACDLETAQAILAKSFDDDEAKAMTRLIIGRRHPKLIQAHWLKEVPEALPQISYALCKLMLSVEQDFNAAVYLTLQKRPDIFLYYEPDPLFSTLILRCSDSPQKLLQPFEGFYGERTVVAAAQWHIEHDQPQAAVELCQTIRPLSTYADQAYLIGGTACLEMGNLQGAIDAEQQISNRHLAENLLLNIAKQHPEAVDNQQLKDIAMGHEEEQAELFFGYLSLLLQRKDMASARDLCFAKQETFMDQPTIKQIMDVVLKGAGAAPSVN